MNLTDPRGRLVALVLRLAPGESFWAAQWKDYAYLRTLQETRGNVSRAARILGVSRTTLRRWLRLRAEAREEYREGRRIFERAAVVCRRGRG